MAGPKPFAAEVLADSVLFKGSFHTQVQQFGLMGIGGKKCTISTDIKLDKGAEIHGTHDGDEPISRNLSYPVIKNIHLLDPATAKIIRANAHKEEMLAMGAAGLAAAAAGFEFLKARVVEGRERQERMALARAAAGGAPSRNKRPLLKLLITLGVVAAGVEMVKPGLIQRTWTSTMSVNDSDFVRNTKDYANRIQNGLGEDQLEADIVGDAISKMDLKRLPQPQFVQAQNELSEKVGPYARYIAAHAYNLDHTNPEDVRAAYTLSRPFETAKSHWWQVAHPGGSSLALPRAPAPVKSGLTT
jgi:hypothetical protein